MYNSQYVASRIKSLAKFKKISTGKMLSDCDLSKNALSTMQSGGFLPRTESLAKIADYLDCSVDYLLGRTDVPEVNRKEHTYTGKAVAFGGEQQTVELTEQDIITAIKAARALKNQQE